MKQTLESKLNTIKREKKLQKAEELLAVIDKEKDDIAGLDIEADTRLISQSKIKRLWSELEFLKFQDIEKEIVKQSKEDVWTVLKNRFIMGVIVQKSFKTGKSGKDFIKFKISDLLRYKGELVSKIQNKQFEGKISVCLLAFNIRFN